MDRDSNSIALALSASSVALYGRDNEEVREMTETGTINAEKVARAIAEDWADSTGNESIPEVEQVGTYTAQFVVETDLGRFRVDVSDIN